MAVERSVERFNRDVARNAGYLYSATDKLSCVLANRRISDAVHALEDLRGKRVIDIGCGDGTYTLELAAAGAAEVLGVDAASEAVERARENAEGVPGVQFEVVDIYDLASTDRRFDVAVVRGILHHLYEVERAIDQISRVARVILVLEPNGYNPVLKILEKVSPYHVAHEEKSYAPRNLDRWFEARGGRVTESEFIGLVPMFCPDPVARVLKRLEPLVERAPGLRAIGCGQYLQRIEMPER
jgi:2-polyprenyl-3-methyl-5-hydroxy-6-metoxy-1,4-benzoquinol methylase